MMDILQAIAQSLSLSEQADEFASLNNELACELKRAESADEDTKKEKLGEVVNLLRAYDAVLSRMNIEVKERIDTILARE